MTTEEMLAAMLVENTGTHFLDSGGAYGRSWQRNQGRDFKAEPSSTISFKWGYIDVTHNLYHWLANRLDYDPGADELFEKWANTEENKDKSWFENIETFIEHLEEPWEDHDAGPNPNGEAYMVYPEIGGLYGEGEPWTINTYNFDNLLSQIIQFTYFTVEDSSVLADGIYIMLQIHGGCDARGGYTQPRVFTPNGMHDEGAILSPSDGSVFCNNCNTYWRTDDAYNWYKDDGWLEAERLGNHEMVDMSEHRQVVTEGVAKAHAALNRMMADMGNHMKRYIVTNDDDGFCPACGEALLEASD